MGRSFALLFSTEQQGIVQLSGNHGSCTFQQEEGNMKVMQQHRLIHNSSESVPGQSGHTVPSVLIALLPVAPVTTTSDIKDATVGPNTIRYSQLHPNIFFLGGFTPN